MDLVDGRNERGSSGKTGTYKSKCKSSTSELFAVICLLSQGNVLKTLNNYQLLYIKISVYSKVAFFLKVV